MSVRPLDIDPRHCLIDGRWQACQSGRTLELKNPSDGTLLCEIARGSAQDIDAAVDAATRALDGPWSTLTAFERGRILAKIGQLFS